jgi:hypothetical protein
VIGGRAAFILAGVIEGSLRNHLSLRALLDETGVSDRDRELVLEAALALREAGEMWRQSFPQSGNAATRGNDGPADSEAMKRTLVSSAEAASILRCSTRRARQLAAAGDIPAERTSRGWRFLHRDVVGLRDLREAQGL